MLDAKILKQQIDIVKTITLAQMKSRYRKTFAGFLWVMLNPILTFGIQAIIFKHILKVNVEHYYLFLLSGVIPWIFITSTLNMTVNVFISNRPALMAFKIDPWVFLISLLLDNFINFLISFVLLIAIVDKSIFQNIWIFPLALVATSLMVMFTFFASFFLATLNVFFRDVQFVLSFALSLAFFVTPVFYDKSLLPIEIQKIIEFNPIYIFIKPFQNLLWKFNIQLFWESVLSALLVLVIGMVASLIYWRKKRDVLYFQI